MSGCRVEREVLGGTALYRVQGDFEGHCAFELAQRLEREPLDEVVLDFSRTSGFIDHGVAAMSGALLSMPHKAIRLRGLRRHQLRLFKYFGVEPELVSPAVLAAEPPAEPAPSAPGKVA